ncbi:hypothetical protein HK405_007990 [Cladochytrium tenue]|nr:hypothetical protein HK405_007990 [Cladochytrium tenue]
MGGIAAALVPGDNAPLSKAGVCSPEERLEQFRRRAELHRRTEADRIVKENRAVLRRLEGQESEYDHTKLQAEAIRHLTLLRSLSTFPAQYDTATGKEHTTVTTTANAIPPIPTSAGRISREGSPLNAI